MAVKQRAPFRADIVGSFLRPEFLKEARQKYFAGSIKREELTQIENEAIDKLVEKEKQLGLLAVTDGEFRRRYWHLDFLAELDGVREVAAEHWSVEFKGHQPKAATLEIADKINFTGHSFLEHFAYLHKEAQGTLCKMTIPSPSMLHLICCVRAEEYAPILRYADEEDLFRDIAAAYRLAIHKFYALGCRYLQLDDTSWGEFCDVSKRQAYEARGFDLAHIAEKYVEMINAAIEDRPEDMTITMHICRGNFRSTWFSSGGYEPIAETLFGTCKVDGFFLEYDSDRAGDFRPLRYIQEQKVVLGLITSKFPALEDAGEVIRRIREASEYVPLEQLCLSPQCGFSSTEEGNALTEEQQWAKIRLIQKIAGEVWPEWTVR